MKRRNETPALTKIGFRVTDEERDWIEARADKAGKSVAEFCRWKSLGRKKV